ncbi:tenascin-X-like [Saccostrea cucullata]|uniref:tenascin-X-like n=1 Tax=Saccostrea cuccullata TaxID=36930 RepID=UPI002ED4B62D
MINLILLLSLVSSVTSQLCYPFVQQDCPLGQRCEQGICQRDMCYTDLDCPIYPSERCENGRCVPETLECGGSCMYFPGSICENGQCVWPPSARCDGGGNLPCSSGYVCRNGICRRDSIPCRSRDCRNYPGSICENGRCVWPPSALCYGRDYLPCSSGYVCTNGFCERDRECTSDSDCPDSHRAECVNGKCQLFTSMS